MSKRKQQRINMGAIPTTLVQIFTLIFGVVFVFYFLREKFTALRIVVVTILGWTLGLVGFFFGLWIVFEGGIAGKDPYALIMGTGPTALLVALISPFLGIYLAKKYRTKVQASNSLEAS